MMDFWGRHGRRVAWLVAVVASLPQMVTGFFNDDFLQQLSLEGRVAGYVPQPHMLYEFTGVSSTAALVEMGAAPWFTHPEFSMRFFRPITSLLIAGEHALFGRSSLALHAVGLGWFLLLVGLAMAIFHRLLTPSRAGLASVMFAAAGGHAMALAWVASLHTIVGAVLGALALWLHLAWRSEGEGWRAPVWAAPIALVFAMFTSETALAAVVLIVGYELVDRQGSWRARLMGAAPVAGLGLAYVVAYGAAGYGVAHSGLYVSPFRHPLAFMSAAATRVPVLVAEMAGALPSDLWGAAPPIRPVLGVLGLGLALGVGALLWRSDLTARERRRMVWLATAAVAAVVPMVGGVIGGRLLTLPLLASMPVVATAIDVTLKGSRWRVGAYGLLGLHLGLASLVRLGVSFTLRDLAQKQRALAESADFTTCPSGGPALLITAADPTLSLSALTAITYFNPDAVSELRGFHVMSVAPNDQRVERIAEGTVRLHVDGERASNAFEPLFRDVPLAVGDEVAAGDVTATVEAMQHGFPTQVRFDVPATSCLWSWHDGGLHGTPLPAVGETVAMPHEPGPMGL